MCPTSLEIQGQIIMLGAACSASISVGFLFFVFYFLPEAKKPISAHSNSKKCTKPIGNVRYEGYVGGKEKVKMGKKIIQSVKNSWKEK